MILNNTGWILMDVTLNCVIFLQTYILNYREIDNRYFLNINIQKYII